MSGVAENSKAKETRVPIRIARAGNALLAIANRRSRPRDGCTHCESRDARGKKRGNRKHEVRNSGTFPHFDSFSTIRRGMPNDVALRVTPHGRSVRSKVGVNVARGAPPGRKPWREERHTHSVIRSVIARDARRSTLAARRSSSSRVSQFSGNSHREGLGRENDPVGASRSVVSRELHRRPDLGRPPSSVVETREFSAIFSSHGRRTARTPAERGYVSRLSAFSRMSSTNRKDGG